MSKSEFLDKLAQLRAATCDQLPTPEMAVLTRATGRLRRSGILQKCLQAGETAPDFAFTNHHGKEQRFYDLLNSGPVVINFFRGFWCSYCSTELEAFSKVEADIEKLGCHYLAISPQKYDASGFANSRFHAIHDVHNDIARKFGIVYELQADEIELFKGWGLDLPKFNDDEGWQLPLPATYLVANNRTVAYQFTDVDFRSRCCPEELIEELQRLLR